MKLTRRKLASAAGGGAALLALPQSGAQSSNAGFPQVPGLTRQVAGFIVKTNYEDVPADVIELGKKSILDSIGLALAASINEAGSISRRHVESLRLAPGGATVIGVSWKLPPRFAAFLNGLGIHGDDYDDTQLAVAADRVYGLLTHPSTTALPAALALAETAARSGRDLMLAYHVGVEVECKIAEAMSPRHYEHGFHSTGTAGTFGSAGAAAKLLALDIERCARTLAIAASSAAGLRENFGTMTKPLHAGRAAESGVVAAELAALGWTATDQILEAPRGFYRAAAGAYDPPAILGKLGNPWTFRSPGISIKPYPSGSLGHPGMTELARLIREHDIRPEQVERLDVGASRVIPNALIHHRPKTHLEAKFSLEFCLASLLLYRKAGLKEFTDEVVHRPEVTRMIERIHPRVDPEAEKDGFNRMTTLLSLRLKNGKTISGRAEFGKGSPQIPMSYEEVAEKFLDCADFARWPRAKSMAIIEAVRRLEQMKDVRALAAHCAV